MISIFDYTNYRNYLRDAFTERRKFLPCFSYRYLSAKLGIFSSNHILLVIQGKRNLTDAVRESLSKFLGLSKEENEYFEYLVSFMHAKNLLETKLHFDKILEVRSRQCFKKIDDSQFNYYLKWYNPVIRELATDPKFDGNMRKLAASVIPPLTVRQVRESVRLLLRLGFIEKRGDRYFQKDRFVTTGGAVCGQTKSFLVRNFHLSMAKNAMDFFKNSTGYEENFSGVTVRLSASQYKDVVRLLSELRKRAISESMDTQEASRIFHLNLQLFPVSRPAFPGGKREIV